MNLRTVYGNVDWSPIPMTNRKHSVLTDYAIMEKFTMMVRMHTKVMRRDFGTTPTDAYSF